MISFADIFRKSFLSGYSGNLTTIDILVSLTLASSLALYIFFIYRLVTRKTFYSKTFNISLASVAVITTAIILTVQSNIVISLGMVGALSIVRFRTAIKDPLDLAFLFWSISVGIICGAGLAHIAILLSMILTLGVYVLNRLPLGRTSVMLVINGNNIDLEKEVLRILSNHAGYAEVKSRNVSQDRFDMVIEVLLRDEHACLKELTKVSGIVSASLLSHDGEVTY